MISLPGIISISMISLPGIIAIINNMTDQTIYMTTAGATEEKNRKRQRRTRRTEEEKNRRREKTLCSNGRKDYILYFIYYLGQELRKGSNFAPLF